MRWIFTAVLLGSALVAHAERILLIPLDSRPAAGQFAQMIGKIANAEVAMPPYDALGRFTSPGKPDRILKWLESQDLTGVTAVIASADMVAYGGLIASRTPDVTTDVAIQRIEKLASIVRHSTAKLYISSSTMRLAPTATRENAPWRDKLTKFLAEKNFSERTKNTRMLPELHRLLSYIPQKEFERYTHARQRDHRVQMQLVRMAANGKIDYLVVGQDDAKPYGPHVPEANELKNEVRKTSAQVKVYFSEGIDQHANLLVSRALLRANEYMPRIKVIYSDEARADEIADFESKPLRQSVVEQILASGARPSDAYSQCDYKLYVNVQNPGFSSFDRFRLAMEDSLDKGEQTSVADVNLAFDGTADARVFNSLYRNDRMLKVLGYAGWNTAGNTLGTSIPMSNVYLLAKHMNTNPVEREVAHKEFLLHRYVDDYAYHKFTRPAAYKMLVSATGMKEEVYGPGFDAANKFVQKDVIRHLMDYFQEKFLGRSIADVTFSGLSDVHVWLPWPRAYEVRLEFRLQGRLLMK